MNDQNCTRCGQSLTSDRSCLPHSSHHEECCDGGAVEEHVTHADEGQQAIEETVVKEDDPV